MLTQEKNRAQAPLNKPLMRNISVVIKCLEKQLKAVNDEMELIIASDKDLALPLIQDKAVKKPGILQQQEVAGICDQFYF